MKVTASQYAKTLYDLTKDKNQSEVAEVVSQFSEILRKNGQLKLQKSIIQKYSEIYNRENGIVEAEVVSREKLDDIANTVGTGRDLSVQIKEFIKNKYGASEVVIYNKIDPTIKGGLIIRVGDEVLDGSVNRQLINLKNNLIH